MFSFIKMYWRLKTAAGPWCEGALFVELNGLKWGEERVENGEVGMGVPEECSVLCARGGPMNRGWGDNWRGTIQIQRGLCWSSGREGWVKHRREGTQYFRIEAPLCHSN